jgi:uncharacterized membrane protein YgdD (TMEM256/DUF423 family)
VFIVKTSTMAKLFISLGAFTMALAVGLGAFGAHALKNKLTPYLIDVYKTGVDYHFYHALGLLAIGIIARHYNSPIIFVAGWALFTGIVIFSGSLYLLALTNIKWLGAITPIGGLSFIVGWVLLFWGIYKS